MEPRHRVVILGGGFGGLYAARRLKRAPVDVTVIDRRNFHLFQPLLYQVATSGLSPGDIVSPIRWILKRQKNTRVWMAEATGVDVARKRVTLDDGEVAYDSLIVATGVRHHYFGRGEWERHAPGLKTLEDATEIRRRVLNAFEVAERQTDPNTQREWLSFVVVGGGPTGVELAGALGELARDTLRGDFRAIDTKTARIVLLEGADRVLPTYPASLSAKCARSLTRLGVTVRTNTLVTDVLETAVTARSGDTTETLPCRTVLWGAGIKGSPMGQVLSDATGVELDRMGRVIVNPDLTVPGHPDIFVLGDLANFSHQTGSPLPGVAPVAMSQGRYAAQVILKRLAGKSTEPYRYFNKGELATIGRAAAVANFGKLRFSGYPAWLLWLFVHLMYLVEFQNRVLVFVQWGWSYMTRGRGTRIIAHARRNDNERDGG